MDKVKRYIIYIAILVLFAIFSEFLISVGLNSTYKPIECASKLPEGVNIFQSEATTVNGRIRGTVKNTDENPVQGKYLKFDFFSSRDVNMGSKYIELDTSKENIPIEAFFKLNNVAYYKAEFTDEKAPKGEIEFFSREFTKSEIFWYSFVTLLILPISITV